MNDEQLKHLARAIGQQISKRWLPIDEAAAHCGVSPAHFKRHFNIKAKDAHGKKVYDRRELDAYMERLVRWDQREAA